MEIGTMLRVKPVAQPDSVTIKYETCPLETAEWPCNSTCLGAWSIILQQCSLFLVDPLCSLQALYPLAPFLFAQVSRLLNIYLPLFHTPLHPITHTLPKLLEPLSHNPMSGVQTQQFELRKISPNQRQRLISHVVALRPPDYQRRPLKPRLVRIPERKIRHRRQAPRERLQWDAEVVLRARFVRVADEVREEKLADGEVGFVFVEDSIGVGLLEGCWWCSCCFRGAVVPVFYLAHGVDVGAEVGLEGCVDGGVVDGDEARVRGWGAEGHGHGDFGAPVIR